MATTATFFPNKSPHQPALIMLTPHSNPSVILLVCFYLVTASRSTTSAYGHDTKWPIRSLFVSPATVNVAADTEDSASVTSQHQCPAGPASTPPAAGASEKTEKKKKKTKSAALKFVNFTANKTLRSQPLPLPSSGDDDDRKQRSVDDFFADPKNVDMQFSDRAGVKPLRAPPESSVMDNFRRLNADRRAEAGLRPVADDVYSTRLVELENPPMHCLGLTLHSVTQVGIQVLKGNHNGGGGGGGRPNQSRRFPGLPELQLTLLDTAFEATGPKFLVRLFYKIMQPPPQQSSSSPAAENHDCSSVETIGLTRIWAEPAGDEHPNAIVFVNQARLETHIRVPSLLMKVIPMSRQRMEQRGSNTLQHAIEKDMVPAMERFVNAYLEWNSSPPS